MPRFRRGDGLLGLIGVGKQEAFLILRNASGVFYALTYLVMFAIPLFGLRGQSPPVWLKIVALSGFLMTLLYVAVSVVPLVQVESQLTFAAKIVGVIVITNLIGLSIFLAAEKRRNKR